MAGAIGRARFMAMDPTARFSDRVALYQRYRPSYPPQVIALLRRDCGLTAEAVVADIGSGTGIFTRLLLATGARVFAVEPNAEMRQAGEQLLAGEPRLTSLPGRSDRPLHRGAGLPLVRPAGGAPRDAAHPQAQRIDCDPVQ